MTTVRDVCCGLLLLALAATGSAAADDADDPRIWLEPCRAVLTTSPKALEQSRRLYEVLGLDAERYPLAQLIVQPSFDPEWVVTVLGPDRRSCAVVVTRAEDNVSYANRVQRGDRVVLRSEPAAVPVRTDRAVLPCELAEQISELWDVLLRRLRPRESTDPLILDGTQFTATRFELGVGDLCGATHSPPEGSPAAAMVEVGEALRQLAEATGARRTRRLRALHEKVADLTERLRRTASPAAPEGSTARGREGES